MAAPDASSQDKSINRDGWPLLVALGITQIISWGSIYYLFALLLQPLQRELNASQSVIVGAYSAALLASGLAAPWVGRTIDRRGGRAVMTFGAATGALLLAVLSRVESLPALYLVWIGLGVAMAATLYEPAFAVLTQAFGAGYRRAITVLTLFGGFASTIFWPLTAALIERLGWRDALLVLAAINLIICVPLHAWLLPREHAVRRTPAGPMQRAANAVYASRPFLALAAALLCQALVVSALAVHLLPLLGARGLTPLAAAGIGAMVGPMQVLGRVIELAVSARASAVRVGRIVVLMLPVALLVLYVAGVQALLLLLFAAFYGAGNGAMTIVRSAVPVELWGRTRYGAIMGWLATPSMLARASGPLFASMLWEMLSGYDAALLALAVVGVLAAIAFYVATGAEQSATAAGR